MRSDKADRVLKIAILADHHTTVNSRFLLRAATHPINMMVRTALRRLESEDRFLLRRQQFCILWQKENVLWRQNGLQKLRNTPRVML